MLKVGDTPKDFTLNDQDGRPVRLTDFRGRKVVVYFYPKDDTPGCTTEACGFRDAYDAILAKGAVVLGVSPDESTSHAKFRGKYGLPFHLLADPEKVVLQAFGAWGEKVSYGKKSVGVVRSTFLLDGQGKVTRVFPKVSPAGHAQEVLDSL